MKEITTVGVDLAKSVFTVHGVDAAGRTVLRKTVRREKLMEFIAALPPCLIGMEACSGAHEWARKFEHHGHRVGRDHDGALCGGLPEELEGRWQRCGSDLRGGGSPEHAVRAGEECRAAGHFVPASCPPGFHRAAHGDDQSPARLAGGVWRGLAATDQPSPPGSGSRGGNVAGACARGDCGSARAPRVPGCPNQSPGTSRWLTTKASRATTRGTMCS
jgi:hypothetical protein